MMKGKILHPSLIASIVLPVVLVFAHPLLPGRVLDISADDYRQILFSENNDPASPTTEDKWVDIHRSYWQCLVHKSENNAFCGMHFDLTNGELADGIDLSTYDHVVLDVRYRGNAKHLRLLIRDYNPAFSRPGDPLSTKYQSVRIGTKDLNQPLFVYFDEFKVADWWVSEMALPREESRLDFRNASRIGLDFYSPMPEGEHSIEIKRLELHGPLISKENWYLAILLGWTALLLATGLRRLLEVRRDSLHAEQMIAELSQENTRLQEEASRYQELSTTDKYTGLLNRRGLEAVLERFYRDSVRGTQTILLIAIDQYERENEEAGKPMIKPCARLLLENCPPQDRVCRWDDGEFLMLSSAENHEAAIVQAERIREKINQLSGDFNQGNPISASIGVAHWHIEEDFEAAFTRADRAYRDAVVAGGNCSRFTAFNPPKPERKPDQ